MLFLDDAPLEALEPKELKRLEKKVKFFDRLALTALFGGGSAVAAGAVAGSVSLIGGHFGLGDGSLATPFYGGAMAALLIAFPTLLTAVSSFETWNDLLTSKRAELKRGMEEGDSSEQPEGSCRDGYETLSAAVEQMQLTDPKPNLRALMGYDDSCMCRHCEEKLHS